MPVLASSELATAPRPEQTQVGVYLVGYGQVGSALTRLIAQRKGAGQIDLRLRGIANTRWMGADVEALRGQAERCEPVDLAAFVGAAQTGPDRAVVVDCTASQQVAALHPIWLDHGLHVATANKKGNAGSTELYQQIVHASRRSGVFYACETTVGAALPVIGTLRALLASGDEILQISGVLSGSVSHILSRVSAGIDPAEAIVAARQAGLTEPDPRDDLCGDDVARKLIILARELGHVIDRDEVEVESLVPAELRTLASDEFLQRLPEFNTQLALHWRGKTTVRQQYVATLSADAGPKVELQSVAPDDPLATLLPGDNIVSIRTRRYGDNPLIIRGPGAGAEITAGGILSELTTLTYN